MVTAVKKDKTVGRTASKEVRRQQLIEATIDSISKHGISGTTMTTVTRSAGLSIGIVNFHFKSKQKLFEETLIYLAEEHRGQWKKNVKNAALTPMAKLLAIVDAHYHPNICNKKKLAVWFAFYGDSGIRASYRAMMDTIDMERMHESARLCAVIKEEGNYTRVDPKTVAFILEGIFDGLCLNILMYPSEFSRQEAKLHIRSYLAAVFPDHFSSSETSI